MREIKFIPFILYFMILLGCQKTVDYNDKIEFQKIDNEMIPMLSNRVVHSFDENLRETINLDGIWNKKRFNIDENNIDNELLRDEKSIKELSKEANETIDEFRKGKSEKKVLPAPENNLLNIPEAGAVENYNEGVWYYRVIDLKNPSENAVLKFYGVNYLCDVWINGKYIGYHEGGFNAFSMNLKNSLKERNEILIRVINPPWGKSIKTIPSMEGTDYFNYTGVIQKIDLELLPFPYIARNDFISNSNKELHITSFIDGVTNRNSNYKTKIQVYESKYNEDFSNKELFEDNKTSSLIGKLIYSAEENYQINQKNIGISKSIHKIENIKEWSVRKPNLYIIKMDLIENGKIIDTTFTEFGFRTIETYEDKLKLNKKVAFFTGIARHEEWPDSGRTATWDKIVKDLKMIYDLRATFVRTAHYPNHLYTYKALDRLGLCSMVEIPIWQHESIQYMDKHSESLALNMWRETRLNLYNSPSIILWSTQNESNAENERVMYNQNLVNDLRKNYNDFRLVTQSAAADRPGYTDKSMKPLDVLGWTMYFGVFYGKEPYIDTKNFIENAHQFFGKKPIINTEFGKWSSQSQEEQEYITKKTLNALLNYSSVTSDGEIRKGNGYVSLVDYWAFADWYVDHNKWIQTMGLVDMDRIEEKKAAEVIRHYYGVMTDKNNGLEK